MTFYVYAAADDFSVPDEPDKNCTTFASSSLRG